MKRFSALSIIAGIGVVLGVVSGVWQFDSHISGIVADAVAQTVTSMERMQQQLDFRDYDLAIQSLDRDIESGCTQITEDNRRRCAEYVEDRRDFKERRDEIRDGWRK